MIAQPTAARPPAPSELRGAVDRLVAAQAAGDGLARLDSLGDVDELWGALRPGFALRCGARLASVIDDAVAELHLAADDEGRAAASSALLTLLA